jgi:sugar/nucleoside kinase (ribokinase family)/fructoselysine-6-P-deglycase FrlB-like protein
MTNATPDVVVVGNLTIDDVVHPNGDTTMASPGGNTIHAATAAALWGKRVGAVARLGSDFPRSALDRLEASGLDLGGLRPIEGPTVRNWVIYEADGRRDWIYRTPRERRFEVAPQPEDTPDGWTAGPVVHVAAMPFRAAARMVDSFRASAGHPLITLDTHEEWADEASKDEIIALATRVDVFVPSHGELAAIVGYDDPRRSAQELLDEGVPAVVVKCGEDGAVIASRNNGDTRLAAIAALEVPVVDMTGAGDAFCGGLAAGLAMGEELTAAARRGAASAGAAIGASGSLRLLSRKGVAERLLATDGSVGAAESGNGAGPPGDDSDVMEREIATIPAVLRDRLQLAGAAQPVIDRLRESGVHSLVLVGCGDSAFACQAAELALNKHSGLRVRYQHALDFARYGVRYCSEGTAVVVLSFSGETGRPIEAATQARAFGHPVIALTGKPASRLAQAADLVLSAEIPTFGFSPGTSTYTAMLMTLLTLAATLGEQAPDADGPAVERFKADLGRLPDLAEELVGGGGAAEAAAARLVGARFTAFLGAGPNEGSASFGAAKLFEGAQQVAVATNTEEWAHEHYFITRPGEPVVLVAPSGAGYDRAAEILEELNYIDAEPIWISDRAPSAPALHLPLPQGMPEELTPPLASIPLSQLGLHLMRLNGKRSYNFRDEAAAEEHYATIHRATIGKPA